MRLKLATGNTVTIGLPTNVTVATLTCNAISIAGGGGFANRWFCDCSIGCIRYGNK